MPKRLIFSRFHQISDELGLYWDFERVFFDTFESSDIRMDGYPTIVLDRNFKNANRYALGGEYAWDDKLTLQLGFSYDESGVEDEDIMPDIPVDKIFKTAFGGIYRVNEKLNLHAYGIVEFLGDARIEQLASINGKNWPFNTNGV